MFRKSFSLIFVLVFIFSSTCLCLAAPTPSASSIERSQDILDKSQQLDKQIQKPKEKTKVEDNLPKEGPSQEPAGPKILVKSISVTGVTVFATDKIKAITGQYENKELTLKDIQQIADLITDLYRQKGYITSRAFVPPQKMEKGALDIKVIEATVGDIQVKGNRFYSSGIIKKYVTLKKGQLFNYNNLKKNLANINEQPDRFAKAILAPGKEPGATDVLFDVKDSLPIHFQVGYNNFLSRFVRSNDYNATLTHNNLLGQDDIFTVNYQRGEANDYYSYTGTYLYPVTTSLDMGLAFTQSKMILGKEYTDVGTRGKSLVASIYATQMLAKTDDLIFNINLGFDYKNVRNYLFGSRSSQDLLRIAKVGFDFDFIDNFGRTIISNDFNYGFPNIMGGSPDHYNASNPTSRQGAGGRFLLDTLNLVRSQKLFFDANLLWKNQLQFSPSTLTATEQYQIGGPANNRGYPVSEFVGDSGYSMNWELSMPPYFIPKSVKVPLTKSRLYDSFRFIGFYDWGNVHLRTVQAGESKNTTLRSAGCGARLNILNNLYARYDIGWALGKTPSNGKDLQQWVEVTLTF